MRQTDRSEQTETVQWDREKERDEADSERGCNVKQKQTVQTRQRERTREMGKVEQTERDTK